MMRIAIGIVATATAGIVGYHILKGDKSKDDDDKTYDPNKFYSVHFELDSPIDSLSTIELIDDKEGIVLRKTIERGSKVSSHGNVLGGQYTLTFKAFGYNSVESKIMVNENSFFIVTPSIKGKYDDPKYDDPKYDDPKYDDPYTKKKDYLLRFKETLVSKSTKTPIVGAIFRMNIDGTVFTATTNEKGVAISEYGKVYFKNEILFPEVTIKPPSDVDIGNGFGNTCNMIASLLDIREVSERATMSFLADIENKVVGETIKIKKPISFDVVYPIIRRNQWGNFKFQQGQVGGSNADKYLGLMKYRPSVENVEGIDRGSISLKNYGITISNLGNKFTIDDLTMSLVIGMNPDYAKVDYDYIKCSINGNDGHLGNMLLYGGTEAGKLRLVGARKTRTSYSSEFELPSGTQRRHTDGNYGYRIGGMRWSGGIVNKRIYRELTNSVDNIRLKGHMRNIVLSNKLYIDTREINGGNGIPSGEFDNIYPSLLNTQNLSSFNRGDQNDIPPVLYDMKLNMILITN